MTNRTTLLADDQEIEKRERTEEEKEALLEVNTPDDCNDYIKIKKRTILVAAVLVTTICYIHFVQKLSKMGADGQSEFTEGSNGEGTTHEQARLPNIQDIRRSEAERLEKLRVIGLWIDQNFSEAPDFIKPFVVALIAMDRAIEYESFSRASIDHPKKVAIRSPEDFISYQYRENPFPRKMAILTPLNDFLITFVTYFGGTTTMMEELVDRFSVDQFVNHFASMGEEESKAIKDRIIAYGFARAASPGSMPAFLPNHFTLEPFRKSIETYCNSLRPDSDLLDTIGTYFQPTDTALEGKIHACFRTSLLTFCRIANTESLRDSFIRALIHAVTE